MIIEKITKEKLNYLKIFTVRKIKIKIKKKN